MRIGCTRSDLGGSRTCELCLKTYGKKWCEMAFVIRSVFYYCSLKGCLQTAKAFARILPPGGEGFLCAACLLPHSSFGVSPPVHVPGASPPEDVIGVYLVVFNKPFADCMRSRASYMSGTPPCPTLLHFFDVSGSFLCWALSLS